MMRSALLSLALVLLIVHGRAEESEGQGGLFGGRLQGVLEPRLAVNAIRYHDLEKHVEKLRARIEEAKHADPQRFLHDIDARLTEIEGTHCEHNEFQCGDNGQECISDLFICDGHKDCHNGHDEDKDVCDSSAVSAGKTFSGITHWTDCLNLPDHTSHLTIIGTRRTNHFSARIGISAIVTSVLKQGGEEKMRHYEMHGGYNFANRRIFLIPKYEYGQANMALECVFDHGDFERLDCKIETEASQHVCAESHLSLQHHDYDDHHDDHHDDDEHDDPRNQHDHHDDDDHDDDDDDHHDDDRRHDRRHPRRQSHH
jgi:hypothetical protein